MTAAMPTTPLTCSYGCTSRERHLSKCADGQCGGCLPRAAEHGALCGGCWKALRLALEIIPALLEHLALAAVQEGGVVSVGLDSGRRGGGVLAEGCVLPAATLEADELRSVVAAWAAMVVEEHPAGLCGPGAGCAAAWLLTHLESISAMWLAADLRGELVSWVARLRARWPMPDDAPRDRAVPDVLCPRCQTEALRYYPPISAGQPFAVACTACSRIFSEREWERLVALVARTQEVQEAA